MDLLTKCLVLLFLTTSIYGRSVNIEDNPFNSSELEDSSTACNCEMRYYQHYAAKNCVPEGEDACGCPTGFSCSNNTVASQTHVKVCLYHDKEYGVGSKILTTNACHVCRCREGIPPYIDCRPRECPPVEQKFGPYCHLLYEKNRCCPIGQECIKFETEDEEPSNKSKLCEYNGEFYPLGAKIHPVDDPCLECLCNENWSGVDNSSCHQHECLFEQHRAKLDAGCVPVYHEKRCCPIEFYCPPALNISFSHIAGNESTETVEEDGKPCVFSGASYELGTEMYMGNPCVKCKCLVPPDFICVHQTCPRPPSEENCLPNFYPDECCPSYDCLYGDSEPALGTENCPTPMCADSTCRIEVPEGQDCPTCVCEDRASLSQGGFPQQTQQVQHLSQEFDPPPQNIESYNENDYNEEELQMLPVRVQDSEGQFSAMEQIMLPDSEYSEEIVDDLPKEEIVQGISEESNLESDYVSNGNEEDYAPEGPASSPEVEPESTSDLEIMPSESPKSIFKRSEATDFADNEFYRATEPYDENAEIEREEGTENGNLDFDPELESLDKDLNELHNKTVEDNDDEMNISGTYVIESQDVPPGCPTPLCENETCHIAIPSGHRCPTCICRRKMLYYIQP